MKMLSLFYLSDETFDDDDYLKEHVNEKTEPENTKKYLCGHEESARIVIKILCKACGLFMKFSFFLADDPRSCGHHLR